MSEEVNQNTNTESQNVETGVGSSTWWESAGISADVLPETMRSKYTSMDEFVKGAVNAQSMIGKGIPDENTPEDVAKVFWSKAGVPESPDKYSWQPPEGISVDGVTGEEFKAFKQIAYDAKLSDKQLGKIMGGWSDIVKSLQEKAANFLTEQEATTKAALEKDWGDKFSDKMAVTMKKLEALGIKDTLRASGALTPEVIKGFYGMISAREETRLAGGQGGEPMDIDARIKEIKANPAFLNPSHPEHRALVKEHNDLYAQKATMRA